jgi:predicted dehydrogenase
MSDAPPTPNAVIWTDSRRVPLVERILACIAPAVSVAAVGGPKRGEVADLAERIDAKSADDLRQMLIDHPADYLLLAGSSGAKRDDLDAAVDAGTHVLALEPIAAASSEARTIPAGAGGITTVPLLRYSPAYLSAAEPTEAIGDVLAVHVQALGPGAELSLFARLADAMDFILHLTGLPDQVDAALVGGLVEPPEQLRGLTGHMTVNLHIAGRAAASLLITDASPVHRRTATIIGRSGMLVMDDHRYQLYTDDDRPLEEQSVDHGRADLADLIARQWQWHIAHGARPQIIERRQIIACCETALLSTRTGQSESTARLLKLT